MECGDASQDVTTGPHQGLEDRHGLRGGSQFAQGDLLGLACEPRNPLSEHHARSIFSSLRISFPSLTLRPLTATV